MEALDFQKRGHAGSLPPPPDFHYGRSGNPAVAIGLSGGAPDTQATLRPGDLVGGSGPVASPG